MADELIAGRYRLREPLGRGAMSAVWAADDEELGRQVAVKVLSPTAEARRFEREARAAAALSHPNIVSLYDYGEDAGRPYMVLELLPGGSLEDRLRDAKSLPDAEARRIALDIASGLAHAHERGLVHRDLKPANILFDAEGRAKIADFGIARVGGAGTLTEAGTVLGTASYISPEQASGLPAGPPSDVYSFGVICFRMLTGRLPFVSSNAMELVRMHRDATPPAVSDLRPDAPPALEAVTTAALAKAPAERPPDGAAVLAALRVGGETAVATAAETQVLRPAAARRTDRRPIAIAAVVALLLLLGGAALALALTDSGGGGGSTSVPGLSLPTVTTESSTPTTTTAATSTAPATTTAPTTTAPTTTAKPTTSVLPPTTSVTAPVTTVLPPTTSVTAPVTTVLPPTTTTPATTDTTPATTATLP